MTRYLVVGAGGMLGTDLQSVLADRDVTALARAALDVTDAEAVTEAVEGHDVVINASAYTRVDDAETHEDEALAINGTAVAHLARATAIHGAALVQISTDYVFDGTAKTPYPENFSRDPVCAYGRTKAEGERMALGLNPDGTRIVRTAWLYGQHGSNFASTMLRLAGERDTVDVITDQLGQPTWTMDLAAQIVAMLDFGAPAGIYHGTNSGEATWFDFAREVFGLGGFDPERVRPTDSAQFQRAAHRPSYSVLGHDQWTAVGLEPMREWKLALRAAFDSRALGAA